MEWAMKAMKINFIRILKLHLDDLRLLVEEQCHNFKDPKLEEIKTLLAECEKIRRVYLIELGQAQDWETKKEESKNEQASDAGKENSCKCQCHGSVDNHGSEIKS
jgi:hypothetical protein